MSEGLLKEISEDIKALKKSNEKIHKNLEQINSTLVSQGQLIFSLDKKVAALSRLIALVNIHKQRIDLY